ncbi:glutaredoxin family protein [Candidatus Saccharibacteria bacterium]|nr:glutaredoxin family protein [Candidatus Saccharibacteria bacterium]
MKVKVYSTSWCPYCHALMLWLDSLGIQYTEVDAEKLLGDKKIQSVPAIEINGNIIYGFDRPAIKKALKEARDD